MPTMSTSAHNKMKLPKASSPSLPPVLKPSSATHTINKEPLTSNLPPSRAPSKPTPKSPSKIPIHSPAKNSIRSSSSSSKQLSKSRLLELEQAFRLFDANGDGKISASELAAVLRALGNGISDEDAVRMVRDVDEDGDGFINLREFIYLNTKAAGLSKGEIATVDELRDVFHVFDMDRNGFITREELHRVLTNLGDKCTIDECYKMIKGVDGNGDGLVDFEEFKRMMMKA